jgi:hypothetical protein
MPPLIGAMITCVFACRLVCAQPLLSKTDEAQEARRGGGVSQRLDQRELSLRRFRVRGLVKAGSELLWACLTYNILQMSAADLAQGGDGLTRSGKHSGESEQKLSNAS